MPVNQQVFRVFIASPSDVTRERDIVRESLAAWNAENSHSRGAVLEPVAWETHATPDLSAHPQEIINKQLPLGDILVGVFWRRLGTPTLTHQSGTQEEIERHVQAGRKVMLYFSTATADSCETDPVQLEKFRQARTSYESKGLVSRFDSPEIFRELLRSHLSATMNRMLETHAHLTPEGPSSASSASSIAGPSHRGLRTAPSLDSLSQKAKYIVMQAAKEEGEIRWDETFTVGPRLSCGTKTLVQNADARRLSKWRRAYDQVHELKLAERVPGTSSLSRLTDLGFDYADSLAGFMFTVDANGDVA